MKRTVSRRSLLKKAGWAAPVVVAVAIPMHASASPDPLCPKSQGYWKNHPESWPTPIPTIGGWEYTEKQLLDVLEMPVKGNETVKLLHQLIPAKLNIAVGVPSSPVQSIIDAADAVLSEDYYKGKLSPTPPKPRSNEEEKQFNDWNDALDEFNNGLPFSWCPYP